MGHGRGERRQWCGQHSSSLRIAHTYAAVRTQARLRPWLLMWGGGVVQDLRLGWGFTGGSMSSTSWQMSP
jgi:hypothetical protein